MPLTYRAVMSFYFYHGFVWACIYYIYTRLIVSNAHALAHKVSPEGQHASAPPSLTPCRMPFVSPTVTGFSRPHVCQEIDHVEKQSQQASLTPRLHIHQCRATRSPAASPLTQTPGRKMGRTLTTESCCSALMDLFPHILSLSNKHHNLLLVKLFICVGLICCKIHLLLILPALSIPKRKHITGFDQTGLI